MELALMKLFILNALFWQVMFVKEITQQHSLKIETWMIYSIKV